MQQRLVIRFQTSPLLKWQSGLVHHEREWNALIAHAEMFIDDELASTVLCLMGLSHRRLPIRLVEEAPGDCKAASRLMRIPPSRAPKHEAHARGATVSPLTLATTGVKTAVSLHHMRE